ncbi:MAG: SixA phosphatase family protein [Actinoallomurus sp.]
MADRLLAVVRHARAGEAPGRPDIDRPLTSRGRRNAADAGTWLRDVGVSFDAVVCSTARRARETWAELAGASAAPEAVFERRVYDADPPTLLAVLGELPDEVVTAAVVGHNPGMHTLVALLTDSEMERFPTCAIALLDVTGGWGDLGAGSAALRTLHLPR